MTNENKVMPMVLVSRGKVSYNKPGIPYGTPYILISATASGEEIGVAILQNIPTAIFIKDFEGKKRYRVDDEFHGKHFEDKDLNRLIIDPDMKLGYEKAMEELNVIQKLNSAKVAPLNLSEPGWVADDVTIGNPKPSEQRDR